MTKPIIGIPNVLTSETYVRIGSRCHLNHAAGQIYAFDTHTVIGEILCAITCSATHVQKSRARSEMGEKLFQKWSVRISGHVMIRVNFCQSVINLDHLIGR